MAIDELPRSRLDPEFAVTFLEEDPCFFRSGYVKQRMVHALKRPNLSEALCARLRAVVLDSIERRGTTIDRCYRRLADTSLVLALRERARDSGTAWSAERALKMLDEIAHHSGR